MHIDHFFRIFEIPVNNGNIFNLQIFAGFKKNHFFCIVQSAIPWQTCCFTTAYMPLPTWNDNNRTIL